MNSCLNNMLIGALLFMASLSGLTAQTCECDQLTAAFFNTYQGTSGSSLSQAVENWMQSGDMVKYMRSSRSGFNIVLPIKGKPVSFGASGSGEEYYELERFLKTGQLKTNFSSYYESYALQVLNDNAIQAYLTCILAKKSGLVGGVKKSQDGSYLLTMKFNPWGGKNSTRIKVKELSGCRARNNSLISGLKIESSETTFSIDVDSCTYGRIIIESDDNTGSLQFTLAGSPAQLLVPQVNASANYVLFPAGYRVDVNIVITPRDPLDLKQYEPYAKFNLFGGFIVEGNTVKDQDYKLTYGENNQLTFFTPDSAGWYKLTFDKFYINERWTGGNSNIPHVVGDRSYNAPELQLHTSGVLDAYIKWQRK